MSFIDLFHFFPVLPFDFPEKLRNLWFSDAINWLKWNIGKNKKKRHNLLFLNLKPPSQLHSPVGGFFFKNKKPKEFVEAATHCYATFTGRKTPAPIKSYHPVAKGKRRQRENLLNPMFKINFNNQRSPFTKPIMKKKKYRGKSILYYSVINNTSDEYPREISKT